MNLQNLKDELHAMKYQKSQLLFLTGEKKIFEKLVKALPDCQVISIRQLLVKACQERDIHCLDSEKTAQLIKELLPREKGNPVALIENEFLIKYNLFTTTMKGQSFQHIPFIIHIPPIYKKLMKNTMIHPVEGSHA